MIAIWEMRFRNFQILLIHVLFTWTQSRNIFESCIVRLKSHNVTWLNPITNQMTKKNIYRSISHICIDTPAADKIITEPPLPQQLGVSNKRYSHSYNGRGKATSAGASESNEIRASGFRCMSSWNGQAENICWPVFTCRKRPYQLWQVTNLSFHGHPLNFCEYSDEPWSMIWSNVRPPRFVHLVSLG